MRTRALLIPILLFAVLASSCADDTVVATSSVEVQWNPDNLDDFQSAQTFRLPRRAVIVDIRSGHCAEQT